MQSYSNNKVNKAFFNNNNQMEDDKENLNQNQNQNQNQNLLLLFDQSVPLSVENDVVMNLPS